MKYISNRGKYPRKSQKYPKVTFKAAFDGWIFFFSRLVYSL